MTLPKFEFHEPTSLSEIAARITVNGLSEEVLPSAKLADLIVLFQEMDRDLIVEHNGRFVFPQDYALIQVAPNDRVEFIHPNFGGGAAAFHSESRSTGVMKQWSDGVAEYWSNGWRLDGSFNTPILHHSSTPTTARQMSIRLRRRIRCLPQYPVLAQLHSPLRIITCLVT
jgi:sulfur carrier protein ThiS